jgi:hypothetical protein
MDSSRLDKLGELFAERHRCLKYIESIDFDIKNLTTQYQYNLSQYEKRKEKPLQDLAEVEYKLKLDGIINEE